MQPKPPALPPGIYNKKIRLPPELEFAMKEAAAVLLAHFNACSTTQCSRTSSAKLTNENSARIVRVRYRLCSVLKPQLIMTIITSIYAGSQLCLAAAVENLCSEYQYTTERAIIPAASIVPLIQSKLLPGYGCTSEQYFLQHLHAVGTSLMCGQQQHAHEFATKLLNKASQNMTPL